METVKILDTLGQKCPQPILKLAVKAPDMEPGDVLEVWGDCPTFERDVRTWCQRLGKLIVSLEEREAGRVCIQIRF